MISPVMYRIFINSILLFLVSGICLANAPLDRAAVSDFIRYMQKAYDFDYGELSRVFEQTVKSDRVLNAISRPAEKLPWYQYRKIFIQPGRVKAGVDFWRSNEKTLKRAEEIYGVPPHIIVSIIGVETLYGSNTGIDRVMDALSTLAFHYPDRAPFFKDELEQFLLLAREQDIDPLSIKGSYAGAMGMPQFIPSSYRNYAVDFDQDNKVDIWKNPVDAIGSVANYFNRHGWKKGSAVAVTASATGVKYRELINSDLKPDINTSTLADYGISSANDLNGEEKVKLLSLESGKNDEELWICFENFYVITRYNHSPLYAMAVYQLSGLIADEYRKYELIAR